MKVVRKDSFITVKFSELSLGDLFTSNFRSVVLMKTYTCAINGTSYNSVYIEPPAAGRTAGTMVYTIPDSKVYPFKGTLHED